MAASHFQLLQGQLQTRISHFRGGRIFRPRRKHQHCRHQNRQRSISDFGYHKSLLVVRLEDISLTQPQDTEKSRWLARRISAFIDDRPRFHGAIWAAIRKNDDNIRVQRDAGWVLNDGFIQWRNGVLLPETQMAESAQSHFLYASIADIQATIRAMDFKANVLLLVLFVPISRITDIAPLFHHLERERFGRMSWVAIIVAAGVLFFWMVSLILTLWYVSAVHDPSTHVSGKKPAGTFYSPTLFNVRLWNIESARYASTQSLDDHLEQLPRTEEDICRELAFEQMKLVYIRSRKMALIKSGYNCTAIAALLAMLLAVLSFVG